MTKSDWKFWICVLIGGAVFVLLGFVTNPLHDALFFNYTSIQDGISSCTGMGRERECVIEGGVRAYNNGFVAILGNTFALATTVARAYAGFVIYRFAYSRVRKDLA